MENFKDKIEGIDINNVTASDVTVIENVIQLLDNGKIRVAEPIENDWVVNEWVKTAILYYFSVKNLEIISPVNWNITTRLHLKKIMKN